MDRHNLSRLPAACRAWMSLVACLFVSLSPARPADGPFQATGFKVGEVTASTARVWTRITLREAPNAPDAPIVSIRYVQSEGRPLLISYPDVPSLWTNKIVEEVTYPGQASAADIRFATPGMAGETRLRYRPEGTGRWQETPWGPVDQDADFVRQVELTGLEPNQRYELQVDARAGPGQLRSSRLDGGFLTAPAPDAAARVVFAVTTGQAFDDRDGPDGYRIYDSILQLDPSFFVHTGDIVYYDALAKTQELAHYHWQRMYSLPSNVRFHRQVASYFMKDDHDAWMNDSWPSLRSMYMGGFTFAQGARTFRQQVPMGERTYRTVRWGRDLQIWMMEGRDYRSPNSMPDGPGKTIWGIEQWLWLLRSLGESDATYKVILSPTAIVGPDADPFSKRGDNHADIDRAYEGDEIRRLLARHENLVVIAGDLHYQYMSIDPNTGLREYGCGPASDAHTTGGVQYTSVDPRSGRREHGPWTDDNSSPDGPRARHRDEYHRYRNPVGGFVSATVDPDTEVTRLVLRFHATGGDVLYEDALESTSGRRSDLADDHLAAQAEWDRAVALAEAAAVSRDSAQARAMLSERLGAVRRLARWTGKRQHRVWLAQSLRGLDQHHESVAIMAHAVRDDPTGARVLIALGDAYRTEGQSDIAALAYRAALHRRDVSAAEALTIGDLFHAVDYWRWSIRAYRKALRQPPPLEGADLEKAHRNLAWDLFREGDVTEAIEHWRVTEGIRSTAQSAYSLAYAYLWIGEADSARALYRRAVTSFGAEKGARLGAVDHLNLLIRKDMQADVARSILHEHWGQPNSRSSGSAASP